jgi:hypothetical protein
MQPKKSSTIITKNTPKNDILELAPACSCKECQHGCRFGSGVLAKGDLGKLASFLKLTEEETKEKCLEETQQFNQTLLRPKILRKGKPHGQCVFFEEEKGCTVHNAKPLACKVAMGCKPYGEDLMVWFMLNHIVNKNDPQSVREYAQYLKTGGKTIPGGELNELVTDKAQLKKILNYSTRK